MKCGYCGKEIEPGDKATTHDNDYVKGLKFHSGACFESMTCVLSIAIWSEKDPGYKAEKYYEFMDKPINGYSMRTLLMAHYKWVNGGGTAR